MLRSSVLRAARVASPMPFRRPAMPAAMWTRFVSSVSRPDIESRVLSVFKSQIAENPKLSATATFQELGLDSLDAVEVMVAVEEEFGIEIPDKESDEIKSVKDAIDYIVAQPEAR